MDTPLIAVCMATYEANPALLERQVESRRARRHSRFVCVVCDDASSRETVAAIHRICAGDERFVVREHPRTPSTSPSVIRTTSGIRTSWRHWSAPCGVPMSDCVVLERIDRCPPRTRGSRRVAREGLSGLLVYAAVKPAPLSWLPLPCQ